MDTSEKWYSVKEVGGQLGVSEDTVRRLIKKGKLRALRLPTQSQHRRRTYEVFRIAVSELMRFVRACMTS